MAEEVIGGGRPQRRCVGCGQIDDHPKCQFVLPDHSSVFWHHDCHAYADPPCAACVWLVAAKGDTRGSEWLQQIHNVHNELMSNDPEQLELPPEERNSVESFSGGSS